jgi:hypothetical protein
MKDFHHIEEPFHLFHRLTIGYGHHASESLHQTLCYAEDSLGARELCVFVVSAITNFCQFFHSFSSLFPTPFPHFHPFSVPVFPVFLAVLLGRGAFYLQIGSSLLCNVSILLFTQ